MAGVFGGLVSMKIAREAGLPSGLPTESTARTSKVWLPRVSAGAVNGDGHAANAPPSTLHSNVEPGLLDSNAHVGVVSLVGPSGPEVIVVSGVVVSITKVRDAAVPVLPAESVARTWNVWLPPASVAAVNGESQSANASASTRHSNAASASDVKLNVGVVSLPGLTGPPVIVVAGAAVSITNV